MRLTYKNKLSTIVILGIWIFVSIFNINKAIHIDDAFHVEAAKWIQSNPLHPMTGEINWRSDSHKIHTYNQPPLYFYFLAGIGHLTDFNLFIMHLFQSIFALLAIIAFYKISCFFDQKQALYLTALFSLGPIFIINQNLMTDMPLLSLTLWFVHGLIKAETNHVYYIKSGILLSIMILIKYTVLPLFVLLILSILLTKSLKYLWVLVIPVFTLVGWSFFNIYEFGEIHIFNRPSSLFSYMDIAKKAVYFCLCLGAIFPIVFLLISGLKPSKLTNGLNWIVPCLFILYGALFYWELIGENTSDRILKILFISNGATISFILLINIIKNIPGTFNYKQIIVALWVLGIGAFTVLFAPFMATRHIMLFLPGIILLLVNLIKDATPFARKATLTVTIIMGIILGISDWYYADFYRQIAKELKIPSEGNKYSVGHWGWQYYSQIQGMQVYNYSDNSIEVGDYLIEALDTSGQEKNPRYQLKEKNRLTLSPGIKQFVSVNKDAALYSTYLEIIPWRFSKIPADTIVTYEVTGILE